MWNKVFAASPYVDDVRFGVDKGPLRVDVARFVGSLNIWVVGVSIKGSNWLDLGVATSTSSFKLFCSMVWFVQPSRLVVKGGKPALRGVMPQLIFFERLLDLVSSGDCDLQSLVWRGHLQVSLSLTAGLAHFSNSDGCRAIEGSRRPVCFLM